jgi:hypothetical protein
MRGTQRKPRGNIKSPVRQSSYEQTAFDSGANGNDGRRILCNTNSRSAEPYYKKAASVEITPGPEIERADSYLTILRWTTNNPGGSPSITE